MAEANPQPPPGPLSFLGLAVIIATVLLDQTTKAVAEARLPFGQAIDLLPILTLFRVNNTGIAFSMFAGLGGGVLTVAMLAVVAIVLVFWTRADQGGRVVSVAFALIVGGAFGNLIDRVRLGHVIDFLLLHIGDRTLFVFNLADAALTVGPMLLILVFFRPQRGPS
jgi:signal peptidase II